MKKTQKTTMTTAALVALLLGLSACDNGGGDEAAEDAQQQDTTQQQDTAQEQPQGGEDMAPQEPNLEDVPDVVAEVNGEDLSGEDYSSAYETQFMQQSMQAQMTGEQVDESALQEQVLNSLIGAELLVQEAQERGYEPSQADIDEELEQLAQDNGMESVDDLLELAQDQGVDEEQLRADVQRQLQITHVVDSLEVEEPTEEEIEEAYETFAAGQMPAEGAEQGEAETPSLEELRPEIEQQLTLQKQNEAATAYADELREDAEVDVHL